MKWSLVLLFFGSHLIAVAEVEEGSEQKLEKLKPFIGQEAYDFVKSTDLSLKYCTIEDDMPDPDQQDLAGISGVAPRIHAYREVLEHGEKATDRGGNNGVVSYMSSSVITEKKFFQGAFAFYTWLKQQDQIWLEQQASNLAQVGPSPLGVDPLNHDIYDKALQFAGGNHYLALKIMSLYGHDNMANTVWNSREDCRLKIMNFVNPYTPSQLYQNGAIHTVRYSDQQVKAGEQVAKDCFETSQALGADAYSFYKLCNDNHKKYQADYYHVVFGAFLGCRGEVATNHGSPAQSSVLGSIMRLTDAATGVAKTMAIRNYKAERFKEEIRMAAIPENCRDFLYTALEKIMHHADPFGEEWNQFKQSVDSKTANMIAAIVRRHRHEIQFRQYQNNMGVKFGEEMCRSQQQYLNNDGEVGSRDAGRTEAAASGEGHAGSETNSIPSVLSK